MANSDPIRVGVLFSRSGTTSRVELSQLYGTRFAIQEINAAGGIDGRELEAIEYDPQCQSRHYRALAERLVRDDGVQVLFGCYMSSNRKAVVPVMEKWQRLLFYPTLYEGFEFSRNVIYTGAAPNQNSAPLAEYMLRNFGSRVYLVGSDYIYPYESNRIMSDFVLEQPGGSKAGERYVRLDAAREDFLPIVKDIQAKQPDFVFSTVVGSGTRMFHEAYAELGLDARRCPIASLTTCEAEVSEMGAAAAAHHITAATYFQSVETPANRAVLERFRAFCSEDVQPNMCWEAAYFQVHLFAQAMRHAGTDTIDALLPSLLGSEFEAPQGRVRIDPANHHTRLYPRIAQVDERGILTVVAESSGGVDADPYMVSHSRGEWSMQSIGLRDPDGL